MIDYKKYKQVLAEIHKGGDSEKIATAICELFDIKSASEYLGGTIRTTPYPPNQIATYPRDAFGTPIPH